MFSSIVLLLGLDMLRWQLCGWGIGLVGLPLLFAVMHLDC